MTFAKGFTTCFVIVNIILIGIITFLWVDKVIKNEKKDQNTRIISLIIKGVIIVVLTFILMKLMNPIINWAVKSWFGGLILFIVGVMVTALMGYITYHIGKNLRKKPPTRNLK